MFTLHGAFVSNFIENESIKILYELTGFEFGEYFGASVTAPDLNSDGLSDLVVGAPLGTAQGNVIEAGGVYIFHSTGVRKTINFELFHHTTFAYVTSFIIIRKINRKV